MFLKAELGWLPGFPIAASDGIVHWVVIPRDGDQPPRQIHLDRKQLHRATYTRSKLVNRFTRVLPRIVEKVEWWKQGTTNIFELLKQTVHEGAPIKHSLLDEENRYSRHSLQLARTLTECNPNLTLYVDALSWIHYLTPGDFVTSIRWMQENADLVALLDRQRPKADRLIEPLVLCELARRDGRKSIQPVVDLLREERSYTCSAEEAGNHIYHIRRVLRQHQQRGELDVFPSQPAARVGQQLLEFARWLIQQDRGTRQRATRLFGSLLSPVMFDPWEQWWAKCERIVKDVRGGIRVGASRSTERVLNKANRELEACSKQMPPRIHLDAVIGAIQYASLAARESFSRTAFGCLKRLPREWKGSHFRCAWLVNLVQLERKYGAQLLPALRELQKYAVAASTDDRLLGPLTDMLETWERDKPGHFWGLLDVMIDDVPDRRRRNIAFEAMALCARLSPTPLCEDHVDLICALSCGSTAADQVCERFLALRSLKHSVDYLGERIVSCANVLATDATTFAQLCGMMTRSPNFSSQDAVLFSRLHECLMRAGWHDLIRDTILDGKIAEVMDVARLWRIQTSIAEPHDPPAAPVDPPLPEWATPFPETVRRSLRVLACVSDDAQSKAKRILKATFYDSSRLKSEIAELQDRVAAWPDDHRLYDRLKRLKTRLEMPSPPRDTDVRKAAHRIERAIRSAVLSTWQESIEEALIEGLHRYLKTDDDVTCLLASRHLTGLSAAMELTGAQKKLALDLYSVRTKPAPWSMQDHPANTSFIEKMKRQRVNMGPWLEFSEPWEWTSTDGSRFMLNFEDDLLEIVQMGTPFGTCLSPGDFNFFSVFANAADVNKKVLFARDSRGVVFGRCLFALSDSGGILVFHPYCHDQRVGFRDCVKDVAGKLADRMNTLVVPNGSVSNLVSSDWYDDGPIDLCEQFSCLVEGSDYRAAISQVELHALRPLTEAAFSPLPLGALTLSLVLELPEFDERPDLILPFLGDIENTDGFPIQLLRRIVCRLHQAGATQQAQKMINRRLIPLAINLFRQDNWQNTSIAETVADIDPSAAIRLIRKTRSTGVRRDEDEFHEHRKRILAKAFRALGRNRKADALWPPSLVDQ